jgi:hypothetical protein
VIARKIMIFTLTLLPFVDCATFPVDTVQAARIVALRLIVAPRLEHHSTAASPDASCEIPSPALLGLRDEAGKARVRAKSLPGLRKSLLDTACCTSFHSFQNSPDQDRN